jgi:hypothetical protein
MQKNSESNLTKYIKTGGHVMSKNKSLSRQIQEVLISKQKYGHSKYLDKKSGISANHIYSRSTFDSYLKHGKYFAKWVKETHGIRELIYSREYVNEYLQYRMEKGVSPYTQKLDASALAKIFGCKTTDFIKTQDRRRAKTTRSRGEKAMDKHFSENRNREFIEFCRATGLRRVELKRLRSEHLHYDEQSKTYSLEVVGKGGRVRFAPILTTAAVERVRNADGYAWSKIPTKADIHSYRADYCKSIYEMHARPKHKIPRNDRYCCRKDLSGIWYDKRAMTIASRALGHNRISVIAGHYLR